MLKTRRELEATEEQTLAPYAMKSSESAGRVYPEKVDQYRLHFELDRDRIIHSKAFRRLQAKTQVFVSYFGDHYRDRMTHSIEVSQICRDICRTLGLNEDLGECLALAHDLGHPPFGHGGEFALNEMMERTGLHFEHNEQSHRIIEKLEKLYPHFDGLNLTKELLDGLLKHNPHTYHTYTQFKTSPHLEAQVADLSDEIAYTSHDVDDGIRSGIITVRQLRKFKLWQIAEKKVCLEYGEIFKQELASQHRFRSRVISKMIGHMIQDLCKTTVKNLTKYKITTIQKVRDHDGKIVEFSKSMKKDLKALRSFLMENFYMNSKVNNTIEKGKKILKKLFLYYVKHPGNLPAPFPAMIKNGERIEVVVKDYIAGMTDHYAEEQLRIVT